MNISLLVASALMVLLGVAHSWLGERYILSRLFRRTDLPHLFGDDVFTRHTLRFAWHITSVVWWGIAVLLYSMANAAEPIHDALVGAIVAGTALASAVVALIGSRGKHLSWIVFLAIAVLVWRGTRVEGSSVVSDADIGVRDARTRFNAAIISRDTGIIRDILLPSYHIVTGRSVQRHGVDAAIEQWTTVFTDTSVRYVRTTRAVTANGAWGIAQETGEWTGHVTAGDGVAESAGAYAAKWQRMSDGHWRLQSEVFTTLRCTGGPVGCQRPDSSGTR